MDQPSPHLPVLAELLPQSKPQNPGRELSKANPRPAWTWADIRAYVRISPSDEETWSTVELSRPHVVIGRKPGCDIAIAHTDLESVHTYLHFDSSGCHAIDLRTRTGMRINRRAVTSGRFRPGDILEVGGFRIRLDGVLIHGSPLSDDNLEPSSISMNRNGELVGLQLHSVKEDERAWSIQSPIAFLGSEPGCAVSMHGNPSASRLHGVLVRTKQTVFYVDLASRGSHINGVHIYNKCQELYHNDVLSVGQCSFVIHRDDSANTHSATENHHKNQIYTGLPCVLQTPIPIDTDSVLAKLLLTIQDRHDQAIEHQTESQVALAQLLRQVQSEQSKILETHLEQIQMMNLEITSLKAQINHQSEPVRRPEVISHKPLADNRKTLAMAGPSNPKALEDVIPDLSPVDSTAWLIDRVTRPDHDQTGPLRELIRRLRGH